ncbi:DUF2157 domain-containing protein [Flavihumibacter sp. CACIAM 22H1]|uniref:DUF2157 domain-containing protein n=1 Tax=Flavihumibacter sp. CACIAM 22H1 TaxID=1812911 RepID=UPI000AF93AB5|nr:DUF2157 domain-containing protein [Flavihumibacter sp. CACIAM 22H1]
MSDYPPNTNQEELAKILQEQVYNDRRAWIAFVRLLLLCLGIGFTVAGIVFFFAYNWAHLHKFIKFGLIFSLLLATTLFSCAAGFHQTLRKGLLTGAAVLVGVLFAVFGQVYQTGANAYDFFLAWTIFISSWVVLAGFPPLWLLYLLLLNTTLLYYAKQVANHWSDLLLYLLLLLINTLFLIGATLLKNKGKSIPTWFTNIVALISISIATVGIVTGIFSSFDPFFPALLITGSLIYAAGIWYGLTAQSTFYLSIIPFSIIIVVSALLLKWSDDHGMLLFVCLFIIGSSTLVIKNLLHLQKKWTNGN